MKFAQAHTEARPDSPLKTLMGDDWYRLNPHVQARFAHEPLPGHDIVYSGVMDKIHCSPAGRLFALATLLIGSPLTPHRGRDVPTEVRLTKRATGGVWWRRTYGFAAPCLVTSCKREDAKGRLCEYVGMGFGMRLSVHARRGALHFISERYFWEVMGVQVPLPHWLSPGRTHVTHEDLGGGEFRFTIAMDHAWLGRTFYQTGCFREKEFNHEKHEK